MPRIRDLHADAVDELLRLANEHYPDPIDVFEDDLAAQLGITRHPGLPYKEWRRIRVQAVNAEDPLAKRL